MPTAIMRTGVGSTGTAGLAWIFMDSRTQSDTDAAAFITAASITDPTQVQAVYTLVGGLKALNLWTKMTTVYPFIGGSAASHAVNLKSPGTYTITWGTGISHTSNEVSGSGSSGSTGNTGLNPSAAGINPYSAHIAMYCRNITAGTTFDLYAYSSLTSAFGIYLNYTNTGATFRSGPDSGGANYKSPRAGFFCGSITAANYTFLLNRSTVMTRNLSTISGTVPNLPLHLFALNDAGALGSYSTRPCSFCSVGSGLTESEAISLSSLVQYVQSMLGRAV